MSKLGRLEMGEARLEDRRGVRSIRVDVRDPKDKPCTMKRHFEGCLRQVVGFGEKLAASDPERFIWAGEQGFLKQARKRDGKRNYSQRQVRYSLAIAESFGIFTPAKRFRNGALRCGFIVAHHDSMTTKQGTRCLLSLRPSRDAPRVRGQKRHGIITSKSASAPDVIASEPDSIAFPAAEPTSFADGAGCLSDCPSECLSEPLQIVDRACDEQNQLADRAPKSAKNGCSEPSNPVSPAKESPVNKSPADPHLASEDQHFTCSIAALDDLDLRRRAGGDPIGHICHHLRTVNGIAELSDYEFDPEYLEYYEHDEDALMSACNEAIDELFEEPFEGRKSRARVMGRAMELLREGYELNVPKGWVPAMKRLRTVSPERRSVVYNECNEPVKPSDVVTDWRSVLNFMDKNGELRALAVQNPELRHILVLVAERFGVPRGYLECRWYIRAVMTCLKPVPEVIFEIRDGLNRMIAEDDNGLEGVSEELYRGYYPKVPEPAISIAGSPPLVDLALSATLGACDTAQACRCPENEQAGAPTEMD
jgi:hypothetical protein